MSREQTLLKAQVVAALRRRGWTVFAAESCTGGLLTKELTDVSGASAVVRGGIVSYVNDVKIDLLHVSPATIAAHTEVSEACAREMAEGARAVSGADIGLSSTGYASDGDGVPPGMVGTVYVGLSDPNGTEVHRLTLSGDRSEVRRRAVETLFSLLLRRLATLEQ